VHLVRFEPGTIVFQPGDNTPPEFSHELTRFLNGVTDRRWVVTVSLDQKGAETYQQRQDAVKAARLKKITQVPFMQSVLETFPGAKISDIREIGGVLEVSRVAPADCEEEMVEFVGESDE
jgi:DNA polymerase-3 subunit gamma/tau